MLLLVALAHLYRGVFPFCIIWSLYPAIFGQATPSAFGRVRLALTIEEIKKVMVGFNLVEIKSLPKEQRDEILSRIKKIEGITQRQAARILGISPNLIFKS